MSTGITPRQLDLLNVLRTFARAGGPTPSFAEIGDAMKNGKGGPLGKSTVHHLLKQLADRGHVRLFPGRERSVEVLTPDAHDLSALRAVLRASGVPEGWEQAVGLAAAGAVPPELQVGPVSMTARKLLCKIVVAALRG